jgi:S1-C subfamily serine protease
LLLEAKVVSKFSTDYFDQSGSDSKSGHEASAIAPYAFSYNPIDLFTKRGNSESSSAIAGKSIRSVDAATPVIQPGVRCPVFKDAIAIPTQLPFGQTNLNDCTLYEPGSKSAQDFNQVKSSVVKINGERTTNGVTTTPYASGFVVTPNGMVATDLHLLRGLKNITVTSEEGRSYKASIAAVDRRFDLAILQVENPNREFFQALPLGSSQQLRPGDNVTAWGYPLDSNRVFMSPGLPNFGFRERVPLQKVLEAGVGRPLSQSDLNQLLPSGERANRDIIESTILVNHGNSGGPLTDSSNQVVGIVGLSDMSHVGLSTPVEPIKRLLSFALQESGKENAKIYFDEEDVSPGDSLEFAQERVKLRSERLELETNMMNVKLNTDAQNAFRLLTPISNPIYKR